MFKGILKRNLPKSAAASEAEQQMRREQIARMSAEERAVESERVYRLQRYGEFNKQLGTPEEIRIQKQLLEELKLLGGKHAEYANRVVVRDNNQILHEAYKSGLELKYKEKLSESKTISEQEYKTRIESLPHEQNRQISFLKEKFPEADRGVLRTIVELGGYNGAAKSFEELVAKVNTNLAALDTETMYLRATPKSFEFETLEQYNRRIFKENVLRVVAGAAVATAVVGGITGAVENYS